MTEVADIVVKRLWTKFERDRKDPAKMVGTDMCEYHPRGFGDRSTTIASIQSLRDKLRPLSDVSDDIAVGMAHARWNAIKPQYEAWKKGEELPEEGTPLAAWNAISHEQASVLKAQGIRTVEDVSKLTSVHVDRIPVPRLREVIEQAKLYLEAAETNSISARLEERDARIKAQQAEIDEQNNTIAALAQRVDALASVLAAGGGTVDEDEPVIKRRPGRPRKVDTMGSDDAPSQIEA